LLVYVSSWIKCFYPEVFACALLNSQPMGFYAPAQVVRDGREHGVEVRPVDVNHSFWDCTLEPLAVTPAALGLLRSRYRTKPETSCADLVRASTSLFRPPQGVDAHGTSPWAEGPRAKPGQDEIEEVIAVPSLPQNFPQTVPHENGNDDNRRWALRLGLRQIKGFAEADAERLVAARPQMGYPDPRALWRRSGLGRGALERLAEADAFRSMGLDRRRALWALKALGEPPLPLFAAAEDAPHPPADAGPSLSPSDGKRAGVRGEARAMALLPEMPLGEHVVEDYASLSLSLKRHPLAFLRRELASEGLVTAAELAHLPVDRRLAIAGVVLIRQRPGSANGVVFITIEDETGIANLIVWPQILERFRRAALGATLLRCTGKLQREESVIHVVADRLADMTPRLNTLRDRTGEPEPRPLRKPPLALPERVPGYDARDIVITSRNFR
jgi:error-prone DNA polymerase